MPNPVGRPPKDRKVRRVPFGAHRTKLQVEDKIDGYVMRWFNDADGRIERAQEGGYVFVDRSEVPSLGQGELHEDNSDLNSKVSKIVSRGDKKPLRAYLMKIQQEWYNEDQDSKEAVNQRVDESLRQGSPGGNVVDNQYVPKGHKQQI